MVNYKVFGYHHNMSQELLEFFFTKCNALDVQQEYVRTPIRLTRLKGMVTRSLNAHMREGDFYI